MPLKKCKVIGCNNMEMDGEFGDPSLRYGYCQIHKIEGLVKEITPVSSNTNK